jgi:hypothetical protein
MRVGALLRRFVVASALGAAGCDDPAVYLNDVVENTLGYPYAQHSEAYLVANATTRDPESLLRFVRLACARHPRLDNYLVRVFSQPRWARANAYDWDFPPMAGAVPEGLAEAYLAEIHPGKGVLTLHPFKYPPVAVAIAHEWCREPSTQEAARAVEHDLKKRTGPAGPASQPT